MKGLFALLAGACMVCGTSLFAQVSISRADIASQVGVLRTSYQWDANDNVSGSTMPDTTGLQAVLQGAKADFTSIVNDLNSNATFLLRELPADVPGVDSFATATHVETATIRVDRDGNDSVFHRFFTLNEQAYTQLGGALLFDLDQDADLDTLVARYRPDGWQIRELPADEGDMWDNMFTQETWVTFPGIGSILTRGTTERREYHVTGTTTLVTPAGSAPAIVLHVFEFITHENGMVDIALERYSFIARSGLAVTVTWKIDKTDRKRIALNDIAYFVPEGFSGVESTVGENQEGAIYYEGVWPNPLRTSASIPFSLERAGHVRAVVSSAEGREIVRLADEEFTAGRHLLQFEAGTLPEGMYHLRMQYGETVITDKIVLCR